MAPQAGCPSDCSWDCALMQARTQRCESGVRLERLRKANEFHRVGQEALALADDHADVADAVVTLLVNAGIAAADVICCARLGRHAQGEDHRQAIALLNEADAGSSSALAALLELKTKAAYSHVRVTLTELSRAGRAAEHLLTVARRVGRA